MDEVPRKPVGSVDKHDVPARDRAVVARRTVAAGGRLCSGRRDLLHHDRRLSDRCCGLAPAPPAKALVQ